MTWFEAWQDNVATLRTWGPQYETWADRIWGDVLGVVALRDNLIACLEFDDPTVAAAEWAYDAMHGRLETDVGEFHVMLAEAP